MDTALPIPLGPNGQAGFVLAKGSLTSKTSGEGNIRKELIEKNLVDCVVNLPPLFLNTQIQPRYGSWPQPTNGKFRNRSNEILFIDACFWVLDQPTHRIDTG